MDNIKLREIRNNLDLYIGASENWADSYFVHDAEFKTLLLNKAKLERMFKRYLIDIAPKLIDKIDWTKFTEVTADESDWLDESDYEDATSSARDELNIALASTITAMIVAGILSARIEAPEGIVSKLSQMTTADLTAYIQSAAEKNAGALVTQIDKTTRDRINNAVASAIRDGGSSIQNVKDNLQGIIDNPDRAQLIAHTESVNSYATGRHDYAVDSGAAYHDWETESGKPCPACESCAGDGFIPVGEEFSGGYTTPADSHPDCYCIESFQWEVTDATTGDVIETFDLGDLSP